MRTPNLIGKRFGKLTVVGLTDDRSHGEKHWLCVCDCGNEHIGTTSSLMHGFTKQCRSCAMKQIGDSNRRFGYEPKGLRTRYANMKTRCYNENYKLFHRYGGRGIKVCDEWKNSYECFVEWALSSGYRKGLTLDRIDNDGDYCPENCRWATAEEQANNRVTNRIIVCNGVKNTLANWSKKVGIPAMSILSRIDRCGWTEEEALTIPLNGKRGRR